MAQRRTRPATSATGERLAHPRDRYGAPLPPVTIPATIDDAILLAEAYAREHTTHGAPRILAQAAYTAIMHEAPHLKRAELEARLGSAPAPVLTLGR